jgi:hypothetical protein
MPTIFFEGEIFPRCHKVNLGYRPQIRWQETSGLDMEFTVDIVDSKVMIPR